SPRRTAHTATEPTRGVNSTGAKRAQFCGSIDRRRHFHVLLWESALHVVRCAPEAMAAQLNRLSGFIGLDTVTLGIILLGARTPFSPKHRFWITDDRLVVADTWNAEVWLDSPDDVAYYRNVWNLIHESAVFDHQAHRLIGRARAGLTLF
ncbi:Scr1 family TA system antitoxin-like transcriptional regulator, partial [Streptomyces sp. NPDC059680]|uniref:Scr1 family TA system antitoxin-like transcriptional regulator n=1 Tax=Streptomyces sp. NPDC059680 TaxID=3346904 RepID=UPI0036A3F2E2